jgi:hypothetical protein
MLPSGTGAAIWLETNFGTTGHNHPRSSPLPRVWTVPNASALFKCILEVVFCEGVQHRLRFCLDHLSCVKMAAFQFYRQSEKQKSNVGGGTTVMLILVKNSLGKDGSDDTVRYFVAKVRRETSYFHAVSTRRHSNMRNWLFDLPGRIISEQSSSSQRKWWASSWYFFTFLAFFVFGNFGLLHTVRVFFLERCLSLSGSPSHFFRDLYRIWRCSFVGSIANYHEARCTTPNNRRWKISKSTELLEILYTDFRDMLALSSTVASYYYNCFTDGTIILENYEYPLVFLSNHSALCSVSYRYTVKLKEKKISLNLVTGANIFVTANVCVCVCRVAWHNISLTGCRTKRVSFPLHCLYHFGPKTI